MEKIKEGLFLGEDNPDIEVCWRMYQDCRSFNDGISLDETVATNENFFIGKQWEGVNANGLPTPVFNILKRDVSFVVSSITSDNISVKVQPFRTKLLQDRYGNLGEVINKELEKIFERENLTGLIRELARDGAVRGDGCLFTYWDPGRNGRGSIRTEVVENTRVYFGNPNSRRVQSQPYIIVESRESVREVRKRARENGISDWDEILPDDEGSETEDKFRRDDKVTVLLMLWRDEKTGEIWGYEFSKKGVIREKWCLGLTLYPIVWFCWDYVQNCYHGEAMLTGLIPNQIFINKAWAMSILSLMTTAYPKVIYDRTRIQKWDNRVGAAIAVNGGDMTSVARIMDPAQISPQIAQFIEMAVDQTNRNLGANSTALGDSRPDNTSAILAMQRAAATPSEITKQNLRYAIEELSRIYIDFMGAFYGFVEENDQYYSFGSLKYLPVELKIDVGASSYYSEIAALSTLDNLLTQNRITTEQYLERIPDGYVPDRRGLLNELKKGKEVTENGGEGEFAGI